MLQLLLSDGLAQIDGCCAGKAERNDSRQLSCYLSHGVGRHRRTSQMPKDRGIGRRPKAPHNLICDDRKGILHKIPEQFPVRMQNVFRTKLDLFIKYPGIAEGQDHFQDPGAQRSQRSTCNAHGRQAEKSENEDRVHHDIAQQRTEIHHCRHDHPLHTPHNIQVSLGHTDHNISKSHDPEILHAFRDHCRVAGKDLHQKLRYGKGRNGKECSHCHSRFHGHSQDLLDGLHITFSPVLCCQDRRSRRQSEEEQSHDILHLAGQGCARQRRFSHGAEHDDVGRRNPYIDQILEGHRHHQCDNCPIENAPVNTQGVIFFHHIAKHNYSLPLKQYVHTLHGSIPIDASRSSSRWNRNVVKFCILQISSTIFA